MWGCFFFQLGRSGIEVVFPTHVGVFPVMMKVHLKDSGLPHACGGVSDKANQ